MNARRPRCGASPPSVHLQPCDKVAGHAGAHRGYLSAVDVVEFWPNEDETPRAGAPVVSVEEALAMRITRDEDEE